MPELAAPRPGFGRQVGYLLAGLPIGAVAFTLALTGLAAGVGTLPVLFGPPILLATLATARGFARLERGRVTAVTGRALPPHHYRPPAGSGFRGWWRRLADPQSWRDLLHVVLAFPLRVAGFVLTVTWLVGGLGELLYLGWSWALPRDQGRVGLAELVFGNPTWLADVGFNTAIGVVLLATAAPVVRALVAMQGGLARALLTNPTAALRARAARLDLARRAAVAAEAQTLRRLERDLHDGPQQRLVRLKMDLEAAARRLDDDPERARPLITEMIRQSDEALAELRALSRGIAPPVLVDRGLAAALAAAAARCPVPVTLDCPPDRFAEIVESTAYFVVTEALTNVAKHAHASACAVEVVVGREILSVRVSDDGRGGAHPGKGHGLAGLADRLATVDGTIRLSSPPGGPTVLVAELPVREEY